MVQAARSVKQNIAEGLTDGQTSFETEIKLLGIAKGSNQELLEDYQDYLQHHNLPEWAHARHPGAPGPPPRMPEKPEMPAIRLCWNASTGYTPSARRIATKRTTAPSITAGLTRKWQIPPSAICHMVDKMMTSFIEKRDREFVEEGGIRERMTAARLDKRGTQKQIIAHLEVENNRLKARIASLERELAALRGNGGKSGGSGGSGQPGNSG